MNKEAYKISLHAPLGAREGKPVGLANGQIGTSSASVSREVADVQRLLRQSNLTYSMHSAGTTVEGPWDQVMKLIGQAHTLLHQKGVVRVQTDIRVGSRTDKRQTPEDKVRVVEEILARDEESRL